MTVSFKNSNIPKALSSYVKNIFILKNEEDNKETVLPFYADGFPGVMFQNSTNCICTSHENKKLSNFLLYGQTIHPIQLKLIGFFKIIVFQLYPSVPKHLFDIEPKKIIDDCYDLNQFDHCTTRRTINSLKRSNQTEEQINDITSFLVSLKESKSFSPDEKIQQAIHFILKSHGKISIVELRKKINMPERTFERRFSAQTGLTPKKFAKIVQFHRSWQQLSENDYDRLTDIVFESGFADQSHFIRIFKEYTGTTPTKFIKTTSP